jgi:exosortase/archaeosortase family protein
MEPLMAVTTGPAGRAATRVPNLGRVISGPGIRLVVGSIVAIWLFIRLVDPVRAAEAHLVGWVLNTVGGPTVYVLPGARLLDIGGPSVYVAAEVTRSCSALAIALGAAVVAVSMFRCGWPRRILAILAAIVVAETFNVVRIATTLAVGRSRGLNPMVEYHNLIGTAVTVIGAACAFATMVAIASPGRRNPARRPRAASPAE